MEKRENIPPSTLLPRVNKETIGEMSDENYSEAKEETIHNLVTNENYRYFVISLTGSESTLFATGGGTTFLLLEIEARKIGTRLPSIPIEDLEDYVDLYIKNDPLSEDILRERFEGYRPENPDLIDYLERSYEAVFRQEEKDNPSVPFHLSEYAAGALFTYELLRDQAERERMKGMNL